MIFHTDVHCYGTVKGGWGEEEEATLNTMNRREARQLIRIHRTHSIASECEISI